MRKSIGLTILLSLLFVLSTFALSWAEVPTSLIVVRADNNTLWKMTCLNDACSLWSQISGYFAQQPTLSWDENLRKYVLIGVSTVGTIWRSTFNADGSHNDDWVQLAGSTPSPVAVAGSVLKVSEIHGGVYGSKDINVNPVLTTCLTYTNLQDWTFTVERAGYLLVNASGVYWPTTANNYVRVCIDDASGGTTCDSWSYILESPIVGSAAYKPFAIQIYYPVNPGTKHIYLKACRENVLTTGVIYWDYFAATWHEIDY
jgi:hypothetical protein